MSVLPNRVPPHPQPLSPKQAVSAAMPNAFENETSGLAVRFRKHGSFEGEGSQKDRCGRRVEVREADASPRCEGKGICWLFSQLATRSSQLTFLLAFRLPSPSNRGERERVRIWGRGVGGEGAGSGCVAQRLDASFGARD